MLDVIAPTLDWIKDNKEWFFSGIGVTILLVAMSMD